MQIYKKQGLNETENEFFCPQRQNFTRGIPKFLMITSKVQLQHLECFICHNIVWKAVACSQPSCFASYCQACISAYQDSQGQKKCPKCKHIFKKTSIPLMNNILSQILLKCPNYTYCDQKIKYDCYLKHSLICDFRRVQCQGCRQFFTQKSIKEHMQNCGDIVIKCEKCNLKLPQLDYKEIHTEVNCLQRMLEQKCAFLDKMEQKMDQLQQRLESYENMFGKIVRGQSLPLKIEFYTSFPSNFIFGQNEVRLNRSSYNSIKQKYDFLHFYVTYPIKTQAPIGFHWRVQIMTLQGNLLIGICSSLSVNSVDFVINRFGQIKKKQHNENKYKLIRKSQLSFSRGDVISFKYLALRKQLRIQNETKNVQCKLQSKQIIQLGQNLYSFYSLDTIHDTIRFLRSTN